MIESYTYSLMCMPYASCRVVLFGNAIGGHVQFDEIQFYSYKTLMFSVHLCPDAQEMICERRYPVDCSRTTARHVNRFTTELFGVNMYRQFKETDSIALSFERVIDFFNFYLAYGRRKFN